MSLFARLKKAREEKKGFTLVELIVVLVILAILAAILIPALLGWIDNAKEKQYVLDARNIYMAAQAVADEKYAAEKTVTIAANAAISFTDDEIDRIESLSDKTITAGSLSAYAKTANKYDIGSMSVQFDGVTATLNGGATPDDSGWVINKTAGG